MLLGVALVRRLTMILGHPTTALGVSPGAVLVSGGLGILVCNLLTGKRLWRVVLRSVHTPGLPALLSLIPVDTELPLLLPPSFRVTQETAMICPFFYYAGEALPTGL